MAMPVRRTVVTRKCPWDAKTYNFLPDFHHSTFGVQIHEMASSPMPSTGRLDTGIRRDGYSVSKTATTSLTEERGLHAHVVRRFCHAE